MPGVATYGEPRRNVADGDHGRWRSTTSRSARAYRATASGSSGECPPTSSSELEGRDGLARYRLAVNPALRAVDGDAVPDVFLAELARQRLPYAFMVEQWRQAGQFEVVREEPVLTARGKFQPFRTLGRA
jgi:hypothetical protein